MTDEPQGEGAEGTRAWKNNAITAVYTGNTGILRPDGISNGIHMDRRKLRSIRSTIIANYGLRTPKLYRFGG